ncbi:hypothetical protein MNBD_GAMMA12-3299 [hydrothermal vent metagenome]|uniref:CdiI C-terminal domain-containing protein n=1 Tax=hydrothermal vent metagenome TaxID=652676 RepID=A0A3B0Z4B6_9ZZZZ
MPFGRRLTRWLKPTEVLQSLTKLGGLTTTLYFKNIMYIFKFIEKGSGEIQIDAFTELFESDHSYWSMEQYEKQWESAIVIIEKGDAAFFIISVTDPKQSNFIRAWACYPIGKELVFQEHIIFLNELHEPFDIENPHKSMQSYENISEDGCEISEWRTNK